MELNFIAPFQLFWSLGLVLHGMIHSNELLNAIQLDDVLIREGLVEVESGFVKFQEAHRIRL